MLTFRLKAGVHILNVDYTRLNSFDQDDVSFANNIEGKVSPRVGAGFLFSTPKWHAGLSVPNFFEE